jgi:hypothetical protein
MAGKIHLPERASGAAEQNTGVNPGGARGRREMAQRMVSLTKFVQGSPFLLIDFGQGSRHHNCPVQATNNVLSGKWKVMIASPIAGRWRARAQSYGGCSAEGDLLFNARTTETRPANGGPLLLGQQTFRHQADSYTRLLVRYCSPTCPWRLS